MAVNSHTVDSANVTTDWQCILLKVGTRLAHRGIWVLAEGGRIGELQQSSDGSHAMYNSGPCC